MLFWTTELRCLYRSWVRLIIVHHHLEFLPVRIHHFKAVDGKVFQDLFLIDLPRYCDGILLLFIAELLIS